MLSVRTRRLAAAAALALALVVVGARHLTPRSAAAPLVVAPVRAAPAPARAAPALVVDVEGAVRRPGLVRLRGPSRVADAVELAGGLLRGADRGAVNLAAPVADGQQVLVPRAGAGPSGGAASSAPSSSAPLSLSTATAEQLDGLPGVGPVTAQKIVAYRAQHGAFHAVEELDAIPGIGPSRLADLKGLVVP